MKSKENKINIEVNIYGTRFTVTVPFSGQDAVRATETQMKAYFKGLREKYSTKSVTECMAMMAYEYAYRSFALSAQREADTAEAEDLLRDVSRLCGDEEAADSGISRAEYGEF